MPVRLDRSDPGFDAAFAAFLAARCQKGSDVDHTVAALLADIRARGDAALVEFTLRFDRVDLAAVGMRIDPEAMAAAAASIEPATLSALRLAADRIEAFHRAQLPTDQDITDAAGVRLGVRWKAIAAVGAYVPGGTASYPSSVLMNLIPARVAGVPRTVLCVPTPDGYINPLVLAAAHLAGVTEMWRVGGAQAIGAMAFGTNSIAPVDKIVGPGNAWVAAAKRMVFGTVGIDMIAGPSEILVVADGNNDPMWIAADILAQAEHDTNAEAILVTNDAAFAERVVQSVEKLIVTMNRRDIAAASWQTNGVIILVPHIDDAVNIVDAIAPEHLELAIANPDSFFAKIRNAGCVFLGCHTPEVIGDYVAGTNHVLPTGRSARFSSGLSVIDFMKRSSFVCCTPSSLQQIGPAAVALARAEGLEGHAHSVTVRLGG